MLPISSPTPNPLDGKVLGLSMCTVASMYGRDALSVEPDGHSVCIYEPREIIVKHSYTRKAAVALGSLFAPFTYCSAATLSLLAALASNLCSRPSVALVCSRTILRTCSDDTVLVVTEG